MLTLRAVPASPGKQAQPSPLPSAPKQSPPPGHMDTAPEAQHQVPCASHAGPPHAAWALVHKHEAQAARACPGSALLPPCLHPTALLCRLETWGRARAGSGAEMWPLHRLSGLQGWGQETLVTAHVSCLLCASSCCSIAPQRHESKKLPTLRGQEEPAQTTMWCAARRRAQGHQVALHGQSCPQDGLSGPGAVALSCQWEPGAARCREPCRLCRSLTAVFVSAAGLQRHYIRGVCWPVQSPEVPEASKPGAALAGAQRPRHTVAET